MKVSNFKQLPSSDLTQLNGGGIGDWLSDTWDSVTAFFQECAADFSEGMYDATGCDGKH